MHLELKYSQKKVIKFSCLYTGFFPYPRHCHDEAIMLIFPQFGRHRLLQAAPIADLFPRDSSVAILLGNEDCNPQLAICKVIY